MNMLATAGATVAVKAMNTAASGGSDVSSEISYTHTKDLLLVRLGNFEFNWFMLIALLMLFESVASFLWTFLLGVMLFGGIALNMSVGGLNPYAVETAL